MHLQVNGHHSLVRKFMPLYRNMTKDIEPCLYLLFPVALEERPPPRLGECQQTTTPTGGTVLNSAMPLVS